MIEFYIHDIGLVAPGIDGWFDAREIFCGKKQYKYKDIDLKVEALPANERRRATKHVRLALSAAHEVVSRCAQKEYISVFASSDGDLAVVDNICTELACDSKYVSPTMFHNSVHNAPAGYCSILTGSDLAYTSLSAGEASFVYGLLESVIQSKAGKSDVLYVAYDSSGPDMLAEKSGVTADFAVSFLVSANSLDKDSIKMELSRVDCCDIDGDLRCEEEEFELIRSQNVMARCLPLLISIARSSYDTVYLPGYPGEMFMVKLKP